jgi:hypothetical protein
MLSFRALARGLRGRLSRVFAQSRRHSSSASGQARPKPDVSRSGRTSQRWRQDGRAQGLTAFSERDLLLPAHLPDGSPIPRGDFSTPLTEDSKAPPPLPEAEGTAEKAADGAQTDKTDSCEPKQGSDCERAVGLWMGRLVASRVLSERVEKGTPPPGATFRVIPRASAEGECIRVTFPLACLIGNGFFTAGPAHHQMWFDTRTRGTEDDLLVARAIVRCYRLHKTAGLAGFPRGMHRCSMIADAVFCQNMPKLSLAGLTQEWRSRGNDHAVVSASRLLASAYGSDRAVQETLTPKGARQVLACSTSDSGPSLTLSYAAMCGSHTFSVGRWRIMPEHDLVFGQDLRIGIPLGSSPLTDGGDVRASELCAALDALDWSQGPA